MLFDNTNDYFIFEIKYNPIKEGKTKLFCPIFINKNKDKCKIIYNGKEYKLTENFEDIENNYKPNPIKIQLRTNNSIKDISFMFCECKTLLSVKNNSKLDNSNIIIKNETFSCSSYDNSSEKSINSNGTEKSENFYPLNSTISSIPLISITSNTTETNNIFNNESNQIFCNVTNARSMFQGCFLLKSLPDLSKWIVKNVTNMHSMFHGCYSLKFIADISTWDTSNVNDMNSMFDKCYSLQSLPDISKWNTERVRDMGYMCNKCHSLKSLPDIAKWNTKNVKDMGFMFNHCSSLVALPNISKFDMKEVTKID